ncbi:MAG: VWA domain-containing protein [Phycisphaeraceae bacterium]|nr:VWA domain-containing protein [Phycisphaeraceae bacterium]
MPHPSPVAERVAAADRTAAPPDSPELSRRAIDFWKAQRWLLLGIGISLPIHLSLMVWLALVVIERPQPAAGSVRGVEIALLPDVGLDQLLEARLPDPTQPAIEAASGESDPLDLPDTPVAGGDSGALDHLGALSTGAGDGVLGPGTGQGRGDPGLGSGTGGTTFFGVRARGTRFGYVIDKSGSMAFDGRWIRLADELLRSLRELPDSASFCVVFFDTSARAFPTAKEGWARARRGDLERFIRWARPIGPGGGTEPIHGFNHLLSLDVAPDAIFFMTDGEIPPKQASMALAQALRRARPIVIHCIQFQDRSPLLIPQEERVLADAEIDMRTRLSSADNEVDRLVEVWEDLRRSGAPRGLAEAISDRLNERLLRALADETGGAFRLIPFGGAK